MGFLDRFKKGSDPDPTEPAVAAVHASYEREDRTLPGHLPPKAWADEMRLRYSTIPTAVAGEETHQDVLSAIQPSVNPYVVDLVLAGDQVEVRIGGQLVGALTPRMSDRYRRLGKRADTAGKRLTAAALLEYSDKKWQVVLRCLPIEEGQHSIRDLDIEVTDEGGTVLNRLSMKIHRVDQRLPDGGWWTMCRTRIAPADGDSLGTTNPYIGHVILATGTLTGAENDPAVRSCATCF